MSVIATAWVWSLDLPTSTKLVALALADYANEDGVCWPSVSRLAGRCSMHPRTIQRHLSDLEERRVLVRQPRFNELGVQTSSLLVMPLPNLSPPLQDLSPPQGDTHVTPEGDTSATPGVTPVSPLSEPSDEPSVEPSVSLGQRASSPADRRGDPCASARSGPPPPAQPDYPADFEEFWQAYPRKVHKGDALRAWKSTRDVRPPLPRLVDAIERARRSEQWRDEGGRFIPHPGRWLRAHGWADEMSPKGSTVKAQQRMEDLRRRREERERAEAAGGQR